MLDIEIRKLLFELIKDGAILFDTCPSKLDKRMKDLISKNTNIKEENLINAYQASFDNGYLLTYDNKLNLDNLNGVDSKLFILDIEKVFQDNLFEDIDSHKELEQWYNESKNYILNYKKTMLFLLHLDAIGYKNEVTCISTANNNLNNMIDAVGNRKLRLSMVLNYLSEIRGIIMKLPSQFHYGLDYFSIKECYKSAKQCNSDIFNDISRNDKCPCGSGRKSKKCCFI